MAASPDIRRLRDIDPAFLARYDMHGPRYTSYPTAPEWTAAVDGAALAERLGAMRESRGTEPLSLYMHLPFCITHCSFCACNVIISPKLEEVSDPYLVHLEREADLYAARIGGERPVVQLHWGGGTPTYLNPEQLRRCFAIVRDRFKLDPAREQSIEVHVNWTSDEKLETLAALGFNRISMGVQDFNETTQAAINRFQTLERTSEVVALARQLGFKGINFDLVYGLPHQTPETFAATVEKVLELRPDRLAVYNFAFLPGRLAHQRTIEPATLPGPEQKLRIFLEAYDRFMDAGYRYIGMDHFALPEDELSVAYDNGSMQRNFMGFTTRAGADMIGMGVSAIGCAGGMFAQNEKKLTRWADEIEAGRLPTERGLVLSADDLLRRDVIGRLMCRDNVEKRAIEQAHGIVFDAYFADELERFKPMQADGLLTIGKESLDLTFVGRLLVRNIAMVFDAYLNAAKEKRLYSKTI